MNAAFVFCLQIIDDPSGNSFIENPFAPQKDTALSVTYYTRTAEHNTALGIGVRNCYSICSAVDFNYECSTARSQFLQHLPSLFFRQRKNKTMKRQGMI